MTPTRSTSRNAIREAAAHAAGAVETQLQEAGYPLEPAEVLALALTFQDSLLSCICIGGGKVAEEVA